MPMSFGTGLPGVFLGLAVRVAAVRHSVAASVALTDGPASAPLRLEGKPEHNGLLSAAVGAVLLAWGVFAFVRFLGQHPLPAVSVDDISD